jgi:hypothetical protein
VSLPLDMKKLPKLGLKCFGMEEMLLMPLLLLFLLLSLLNPDLPQRREEDFF